MGRETSVHSTLVTSPGARRLVNFNATAPLAAHELLTSGWRALTDAHVLYAAILSSLDEAFINLFWKRLTTHPV